MIENKELSALLFVKLYQIIGSKKRGIPPLLPVSRSTFLNRVKDGTYPQPVKLGVRAVAWRVSDIQKLLSDLGV